jgi:hypothetical protein
MDKVRLTEDEYAAALKAFDEEAALRYRAMVGVDQTHRERAERASRNKALTPLTPHLHREFVDGCFRCNLSRDEV